MGEGSRKRGAYQLGCHILNGVGGHVGGGGAIESQHGVHKDVAHVELRKRYGRALVNEHLLGRR